MRYYQEILFLSPGPQRVSHGGGVDVVYDDVTAGSLHLSPGTQCVTGGLADNHYVTSQWDIPFLSPALQ